MIVLEIVRNRYLLKTTKILFETILSLKQFVHIDFDDNLIVGNTLQPYVSPIKFSTDDEIDQYRTNKRKRMKLRSKNFKTLNKKLEPRVGI